MMKVKERLSDYLDRLRVLLYLIRQEKIHRFFLLLVFLMLLFAVLFLLIEYQSIVETAEIPIEDNFFSKTVAVIYWSIITMSTTGYGDILPQTDAGRIMVTVMLFMSVVAVSLFTANLASALTTRKLLEGRGIMSLAKMRDHFVICGWKNRMGEFIEEIVSHNPDIDLKRFIIIANIESDGIELFRQNYPDFEDITILRGEHYNEALLRKSNVEQATKVLILADERHAEESVGVDSITVLTAMTIRSISHDVALSAELNDLKFEKYFHLAHVDEIVYTNKYSSSLLANSIMQVGVTNVINDLMIRHGSAYLKTETIPEDKYGKSFKELKEYFQQNDNILLIGLLENVGGFSERKREAIRTAQKTSDVKTLIGNLKMAKEIETNQSNLIPDDDYIVPDKSLAIVIERGK